MTPFEKSFRELRFKMTLRGVVFAVLMISMVVSMFVGAVRIPSSTANETAISAVKESLYTIAVCDLMAAFCLLGAVYLILDTFAMLIRNMTSSVKVYKMLKDPGNPHLKPDNRPAKLFVKSIIGYIIALGAAGFISVFCFCRSHSFLCTAEGDFGIKHLRNTIYNVTLDEKLESISTGYIDVMTFETCGVPYIDKLGSNDNCCWVKTADGVSLPITVLDKAVMQKLWERNEKRRENIIKVRYFKRSGLIESYEFVSDHRDIERFDLPKVGLELDDSFVVTRPEDMKEYGDIAWLVERNGELMHPKSESGSLPYSLPALTKALDIPAVEWDGREDITGTYTVTLVKVFTYPDPEGYSDPETEVLPVSDTVSFTVAGGSDIIKALGDEKLNITVDEKAFTVTMPKLPDGFARYVDIFLAQEMTGRLVGAEFGYNPYTINYDYAEGQTVNLRSISAHHKIYAYALDDEGNAVPISNIVEFDYMTDEDRSDEDERQKKLEFFEPVLQALENHDSAAIKALFSKNVIDNNADIDKSIEKVFKIYKGGKIDRDALYPYTEEYTSYDGKTQECYGNLWITTVEGTSCRIDITRCYKNGDIKDNVGMTYFSISDGETYDSFTIR